MIQRGKCDYDRAEFLEAEKRAGLNVCRGMVLALRAFRDTLAALLNLCADPTVVQAETGLERGLLASVRLGVGGACGNGWEVLGQ